MVGSSHVFGDGLQLLNSLASELSGKQGAHVTVSTHFLFGWMPCSYCSQKHSQVLRQWQQRNTHVKACCVVLCWAVLPFVAGLQVTDELVSFLAKHDPGLFKVVLQVFDSSQVNDPYVVIATCQVRLDSCVLKRLSV